MVQICVLLPMWTCCKTDLVVFKLMSDMPPIYHCQTNCNLSIVEYLKRFPINISVLQMHYYCHEISCNTPRYYEIYTQYSTIILYLSLILSFDKVSIQKNLSYCTPFSTVEGSCKVPTRTESWMHNNVLLLKLLLRINLGLLMSRHNMVRWTNWQHPQGAPNASKAHP